MIVLRGELPTQRGPELLFEHPCIISLRPHPEWIAFGSFEKGTRGGLMISQLTLTSSHAAVSVTEQKRCDSLQMNSCISNLSVNSVTSQREERARRPQLYA